MLGPMPVDCPSALSWAPHWFSIAATMGGRQLNLKRSYALTKRLMDKRSSAIDVAPGHFSLHHTSLPSPTLKTKPHQGAPQDGGGHCKPTATATTSRKPHAVAVQRGGASPQWATHANSVVKTTYGRQGVLQWTSFPLFFSQKNVHL